jgi:hypothetical protein
MHFLHHPVIKLCMTIYVILIIACDVGVDDKTKEQRM